MCPHARDRCVGSAMTAVVVGAPTVVVGATVVVAPVIVTAAVVIVGGLVVVVVVVTTVVVEVVVVLRLHHGAVGGQLELPDHAVGEHLDVEHAVAAVGFDLERDARHFGFGGRDQHRPVDAGRE